MTLRGPPKISLPIPQKSSADINPSPREEMYDPMLRGSDSFPEDLKTPSFSSTTSSYQPQPFDSIWKWKWELVSLLGTLNSLIAIVLVLNHYDGKASPAWPYEITLNTLLSVFSTLLKALMMFAVAECISQLKWIWFKSPRSLHDLATFEDAARGPLGSVYLMFTLKFHHFAALGAVITIFTIAVDPSIQQAIRVYPCEHIEINKVASIPIAKAYAPKQFMLDPIEVAMVGAIYNGLLNPSFNGSFVDSNCPTGNCTFPVKYTSFGVCSACTNLVYDIQNEFQNVTYAMRTADGTGLLPTSRVVLNSTFPGAPADTAFWDELSMVQPPFDMNITQPLAMLLAPINQPLNFSVFPQSQPSTSIGNYLAGFNMLSMTRDSTCTSEWMRGGLRHPETDCLVPSLISGAQAAVPTCETSPMDKTVCLGLEDWDSITASTCALSLCGKTYSGAVSNGIFTETLISSSNAVEVAGYPNYGINDNRALRNTTSPAYLLSPCWHNNIEYADIYGFLGLNTTLAIYGHQNLTAADLQAAIAAESGPLDYTYMASVVASSPAKKAVFDACIVHGTPLAFSNLAQYLAQLLSGNVTGLHLARGATQGNPGKNWASTAIAYTTPILSPFYARGAATPGNTRAAVERLAAEMTNHMRTSDPDGASVLGEVNGKRVCVRVAWSWLVLPALLVVASAGLLAATMWKAEANVWKSSPLAYLFHGLSRESRATVQGDLVSVNEMNEIARGKDAALRLTGEGWRFVVEDVGKDGLEKR